MVAEIGRGRQDCTSRSGGSMVLTAREHWYQRSIGGSGQGRIDIVVIVMMIVNGSCMVCLA